ncbi:electron transfer flavoprotein subunit alpha/FixB family protein [Natranaeroarchaeum sulfidigenes]|uniref:Electron transfer flavoprotein, alpha subunit n=1 Tax=Natranaeroarchaeum sulfidigenes TaxID=2784880 RepID=A0A897MSV0_9EURY|nr:electron transfer flavoprotein subunit alpha/FixB family protein [Natranaeroarchaeum sulfidigenes]QSG03624.1 Electron transfer flavoprotein, alpha subunit [Natranaeroarchaeum sulfidigenes]
MVEIDPTEYDISELGPKIKDVEDLEELEAMLDLEADGEDRVPVKTLIESRIEALSEDDGDGDEDADITELSTADAANLIRDIDDPERLEELQEIEEAGENRDTVLRLIGQQLDSVLGSEETDIEIEPPEEAHPHLDHPTADKAHVRSLDGGEYRDMWVYCETQAGELVDVSKELLGKARELMDEYNEEYEEEENVVAVVIGSDVEGLAEETIAYGADVALYQDDPELERFRHKPYTEIYCDMARSAGHPYVREDRHEEEWRDYDEPRYVVFPATHNGRDLSALVQAELDSGLASDCSDLYIDDVVISNPAKTGGEGGKKRFERVLHMPRPDFSGFEYSTILCLDSPRREFHPQGASVIPGKFEMPEPDYEREGQLIEHDLELDDDWLLVDVEEYDLLESGVDLTDHQVVVCVGRGIDRDPTAGIELGLELTDAFEDAAFGLTRGIITSSFQFDGHVEEYTGEDRQIGESGQEVQPSLYIAAGVSGAIQHKVGCDESDTIVAINTDPDADIRDWSDYYIQGDLFEVLPNLIEALESGDPSDAIVEAAVATDGGERDD